MESDFRGLSRLAVSDRELKRQFRVLDQTLSMHAILRDRYAKLTLGHDLVFLICSVIFCVTTFARDDLFTYVGLSPIGVRYILGVASIVAFMASLVALRVNWKGKLELHRDAVLKLSSVAALFRESRKDDGTWYEDQREVLNRTYWDAMNNVIKIPDNKFVGLKAKHLQKRQLSKMLDSTPGRPVWLLRLILLYKSIHDKRKEDNQQ